MTPTRPQRSRPRLRGLALAGLAIAAVGVAAACGDDEAADVCAEGAAVPDAPHAIPTEPAAGAVVGETFTVRGCSRTFESNVQWRLSDPTGRVIARGFTMGGGVDGSAPFEIAVTADVAEPTLVELRVFEEDASEGEGGPPPQAVLPLLLMP